MQIDAHHTSVLAYCKVFHISKLQTTYPILLLSERDSFRSNLQDARRQVSSKPIESILDRNHPRPGVNDPRVSDPSRNPRVECLEFAIKLEAHNTIILTNHRGARANATNNGASPRGRACAFSLVELVIVIVIIGIIAAIAVPRFSSATTAARSKTVAGTLRIVNDAMERYKADHGYYPGMKRDGTMYPNGMFVNELLAPLDGTEPYLRGPSFPANSFSSFTTVKRDVIDPAADPGAFGWIANLQKGTFNINMWKSSVPTDFDLCDLIATASPALISYDHPGAAACGGG